MNREDIACHIISDITGSGYIDAEFLVDLYQLAKAFDKDFFIDKGSSFYNLNINELIYRCLESIRDSIAERLKKEIEDYINIDLYRQWIEDNIENADIYCNGLDSILYIHHGDITSLMPYKIDEYMEDLISVMIEEVEKYQEEQR